MQRRIYTRCVKDSARQQKSLPIAKHIAPPRSGGEWEWLECYIGPSGVLLVVSQGIGLVIGILVIKASCRNRRLF